MGYVEVRKEEHEGLRKAAEKQDWAAVGALLAQNVAVQELELAAFGSSMGPEGAAKVAAGLEKNTTLTEIDLGGNGIGTKGAAKVAVMLEKNTTLEGINLNNNGIGAEGAAKVAAMLEKNTTLTSINLYKNWIGAEGAAKVAAMLEKNTTLTEINLKYNNTYDANLERRITAALERNMKRERADGDGGASGSGTAPPPPVVGLDEVTSGHPDLVASRATAQAWCDANGVPSVAFLKEFEMEDELIAALKLKAGPAKKLAKDIRDYAPAAESRAKRSRR